MLTIIFFGLSWFSYSQIANEQEWQLKYDQATALKQEKKWVDYLDLLEECYAFAKANFSEIDTRREEVTYSLGKLYWQLNAYEKALPFTEETFVLTRNIYGENHANYIIALNDWGYVLMHLGKHMDALNKFAIALKKFDSSKHETRLREATLQNADWSLERFILEAYKNSTKADTKKREDIHNYLFELYRIRKELYEPCSAKIVETAQATGLMREELGLKKDALRAYEYLDNCSKSNDAIDETWVTNRLAVLNADLGNFKKAFEYRYQNLDFLFESDKLETDEYWVGFENAVLLSKLSDDQEIYSKFMFDTYNLIQNYPEIKSRIDKRLLLDVYNSGRDYEATLPIANELIKQYNDQNSELKDLKSVYQNAIQISAYLRKEKEVLSLLEQADKLINRNDLKEEDIFFLHSQARIWIKYGQFLQAQVALNQSRKWLENNNIEFRKSYLDNLSSNAEINRLLDNNELASGYLLKALGYLNQRGQNDSMLYIEYLNKLADLRKSTNQEGDSKRLYRQALELLENFEHSTFYFFDYQLQRAIALDGIGRAKESTDYYKKLAEFEERTNKPVTSVYLERLEALAQHYFKLGDLLKSEELYTQLTRIPYESDLTVNIDLAGYHYGLADVLFAQKKYKDAINHYELSLTNRFVKNVEEYSVNIGDYCNLKLSYYELGEQQKFISATQDEIQRLYASIDRKFPYLSEQQRFTYLQSHDDQINEIKKLVINGKYQGPKLDNLLADLIINLKGLLVTSNREALESLSKTVDPQIQQLFKDYRAVQQQAVNSNSTNELLVEWWQDSALVFGIDFNSAIAALYAKGKDLQFTSQQWKEDIGGMSNNEAVVIYDNYLNQDNEVSYYAILLRGGDSSSEIIKLSNQEAIQEAIISQNDLSITTRGSISKNKREKKEGSFSDVYRLVWSPIEKSLKGINKVYLMPEGLLHNLPFSILPVEDQMLFEKYDLVQITSLKSLPEEVSVTLSSALLVGGVDYGSNNTANSTWVDLPGTATEVDQIAKQMNEQGIANQILTNEKASEDALKSIEENKPDILHIATHGFFNDALSRREVYAEPDEVRKRTNEGANKVRKQNDENSAQNLFINSEEPLNRSGLILAGGNEGYTNGPLKAKKNDGVLTALEITNLNLSDVELAVLSACNTALGDVKANEGVYGLQRAFKMAGVDHLLISLWEVPDKETVEFMDGFYKNLLSSKDLQKAFKTTQRAMKVKYPDDPSKWAAFILVK